MGKNNYGDLQELKIEKIAAGVPDYDIDVEDMWKISIGILLVIRIDV